MARRTPNRPNRQQGFTLLELLAVVTIIAAMSIVMLYMARDYLASQRNAAIAANAVQLHKALDGYVRDNQAALATKAMPYAITVPMLQAPAAYINPGFNATNNAGQVPAMRVIKDADGSLEVVIAYMGGNAISEGDLDDVAANMVQQHAAGGYIHAGAGTVATGYQGSWVKDLAAFGLNPGSGRVVDFLSYTANANADDSLHRHAVPGSPQYNQMATNLDMGTHNIVNAGDISARTLTLPNGGNAINIGGSFIYGDNANLAMRSASGNLYIQNSTGGASGSIVQVHNITGDGSSTFTAYNISASNTLYAANSVVSSGDVSAGGAVYASNWLRTYGATGWYSQTYGGGWYMSDPTWIRAYGDKNIYTGGEVRGGTLHSTGNVIADGALVVNATAAIGSGCSTKGAIAQSSSGTGEVVMCKSGRWTAMGGYTQFTMTTGPYAAGFTESVATCPAGWNLLSGGYYLQTNPYTFTPGVGESRPVNATQWRASPADNRVGLYAVAYCAR